MNSNDFQSGEVNTLGLLIKNLVNPKILQIIIIGLTILVGIRGNSRKTKVKTLKIFEIVKYLLSDIKVISF